MIIDPRNMTVSDWCDSMSYTLEKYGTISRLDDPSKWQDWALGVVSYFDISRQNPPNPLDYTDWQDWAFAFTKAVNLGY